MMMASIVTLPVLVFTMCLGLLPIALLVVLQVFLCRKSGKLGLILPILSLLLSFALTSVLGFDNNGTALMLTIFALQDSFGTACNITGDGALTLILTGYAKKHHIQQVPDTEIL